MPAPSRSASTPFRPAPRNRARTRRLRSALSEGRATLTVDGAPFALPAEVAALLDQAVEYLAGGEPVLLIPAATELSTGEAAEILGFSRQYLVRLLDEDRIPHRREGAHRRLLLRDVIRFRETRRAEQAGAVREMIQLSEEVGAYDWTEADFAAMDDDADRNAIP